MIEQHKNKIYIKEIAYCSLLSLDIDHDYALLSFIQSEETFLKKKFERDQIANRLPSPFVILSEYQDVNLQVRIN